MAEYDWKPENVRFYLTSKAAVLAASPESFPRSRSVNIPGFMLGFTCKEESPEECSETGYDNRGLTLDEAVPVYALRVAAWERPQVFEAYSWVSLGKSSQRQKGDEMVVTERFGLKRQHPYEGSIDSVLLYETVSYEGDCGPRPAFEAFFHTGKLVAGWDYQHFDRRRQEQKQIPVENDSGLKRVLDAKGEMPHPSSREVRDFLRRSNLIPELLRHFEELLQ